MSTLPNATPDPSRWSAQPPDLSARNLGADAPVTAGSLMVRLASSDADIEAAQRLRYRVFYEEMGARASAETLTLGRDCDAFDGFADHLLVIDHGLGTGPDAVIGTYRLLRRGMAARCGGFYAADEYDIAPLLARPGEILELGRSCVGVRYRTRPTMQLLWKGIAAYVFHHDVALMFGCASLPGTDIDMLSLPLSYLRHHHLAPAALRARAVPERRVDMDLMPSDSIDERRALAALPPLLKGYLRLGGFVGDGAVIDHQFNTVDVCMIVPTNSVSAKYYRHYERETRRASVQ